MNKRMLPNVVGKENMKFCPRCNRFLFRSEFNKNRGRKDGLSGYCKSCQKKAKEEYQKRKDEIERLKMETKQSM